MLGDDDGLALGDIAGLLDGAVLLGECAEATDGDFAVARGHFVLDNLGEGVDDGYDLTDGAAEVARQLVCNFLFTHICLGCYEV